MKLTDVVELVADRPEAVNAIADTLDELRLYRSLISVVMMYAIDYKELFSVIPGYLGWAGVMLNAIAYKSDFDDEIMNALETSLEDMERYASDYFNGQDVG